MHTESIVTDTNKLILDILLTQGCHTVSVALHQENQSEFMPTQDQAAPEVISFTTPKEFEKWLKTNHKTNNGIWLRMFKKDSKEKSINYEEAVNAALCFGWIDGRANSYDAQSWIQKFTPRRPKSIWSKRNTERIERLIKEGRIKPAGMAEVEKAKADGRWDKAYAPPSEMSIPADFLKALSKNKKAKAFYATLNKTNLFAIGFRLNTAKKEETRQRRMKVILTMLAKGEKCH